MNRDLRAVLHEFTDVEERAAAAAAPDPAAEARALASRVRRRRATRAGGALGGAAAAVLVGAIAVQGLTGPAPTPPSETATPTPSPTRGTTPEPTTEPEPTSAPEPTEPAGPRVLGGVTEHPMLPVGAQPLVEGQLEAAGEGWSLVTYYDYAGSRDDDIPEALYLAGPGGELFEVPTPVELVDWEYAGDTVPPPTIDDWLAGTTLVLTSTYRWEGEGSPYDQDPEGAMISTIEVVDVLTGEVRTRVEQSTADGESLSRVRFAQDGTGELIATSWVTAEPGVERIRLDRLGPDGLAVRSATVLGSSLVGTSPDGSRAAFSDSTGVTVVALDTLREVARIPWPAEPAPDLQWCRPHWVDDETLMLVCTDPQGEPGVDAIWTADARGGAPRAVGRFPSAVWTGFDGRLMTQGSCGWELPSAFLAVAPGGAQQALPAIEPQACGTWGRFAHAGGRMVIAGGPADEYRVTGLYSVDPVAGTADVLVEIPADAAPSVDVVAVTHGHHPW